MTTLFLTLAAVSAMVAVAIRTNTTVTELSTDEFLSGVGQVSPRRGGGGATTGTADEIRLARLAARGSEVERGAPIWRRVIDLVLLVAIWLGIGLGIAALLAGALAGAALLLQEVLA